jgi:TM2 domain-containing membrane protein YozV
MTNIYQLMPFLEGEELMLVQSLIKDLNDQQAQQFAVVYSARRKDPQVILLTTLLGFIIVAGVQRFLLGQIGMGILYLFTGGLCLIGTIIDLINYKKLSFEYNQNIARESLMIARSL